jgi:diaminopimelate epimerase
VLSHAKIADHPVTVHGPAVDSMRGLAFVAGRLILNDLMDSFPFVKMSGAGNDFVVVDNRTLALNLTREQIANLCHRHFGIGADGLLAAEPAGEAGADFRMRYYNADGGEAEMCGNGARCFARFVEAWPRTEPGRVRFLTQAGLITGEFVGHEIRVDLTPPTDLKLDREADFGWGRVRFHSINTGVPHAVVEVPDVELAEVMSLGRAIRHSKLFANGTNVNFVQATGAGDLVVRTYERGVEGETLACGTGVVAAALIMHRVRNLPLPVRVRVRGGDTLTVGAVTESSVNYGDTFRDVTLTGPATEVYSGTVKL